MIIAPRPTEPTPIVTPTPAPAGGRQMEIFDLLAALLVVMLAFLAASFAAKNSDLWQHLAYGRLLTQGEATFGSDPFSYATAGATWVNHSWLADWASFKIYDRAGGAALVAVKALLVALAALIAIIVAGRRGFILVGTAFTLLAIVAMAPQLLLQSAVLSIPLLAGCLALTQNLATTATPRKSWLGLGLLGCLWANVDAWFFLEALVLIMATLGHLLDRFLKRETDKMPLQRLLFGLLAFGIGACVGPHHLQVWSLPSELVSSGLRQTLQADEELQLLIRSGLNATSLGFSSNAGNWHTGVAYLLLLVVGIFGFALNFKRFRGADLLIFLLLAGLSIYFGQSVPLFAIAAALIVPRQWGEVLAAWMTPTTEGAPRGWNLGMTLARSGLILAGLGLCLSCWPGLLHPNADNPHTARWLAWEIEPDPLLERAALGVKDIRDTLPDDVHGICPSIDLANYLAWYAPKEKVFFDSRYSLHAARASSFVKFRQRLATAPSATGRDTPTIGPDENELFRNFSISYLIQSASSRSRNLQTLIKLWREPYRQVGVNPGPQWIVWKLAGGGVILGWAPQEAMNSSDFAAHKLQPARDVFALHNPPLPEPTLRLPPPQSSWFDRLIARPLPIPPEVEELYISLVYQQSQLDLALRYRQRALGMLGGSTIFPFNQPMRPFPATPDMLAQAVQAVRLARIAVANNPDHGECHDLLAQAYGSPLFLISDDRRELQTMIAYERGLLRGVSTDPTRQQSQADMVQTALRLYQAHRRANHLDIALEHLRQAERLLRMARPEGRPAEDAQARELQELSREAKALEDELVKRRDSLELAGRGRGLLERAVMAQKAGLWLELERILHDADGKTASPQEELGRRAGLMESLTVSGHLEEAWSILEQTLSEVDKIDDVNGRTQELARFRGMSIQASWQIGKLDLTIEDLAQAAKQFADSTPATELASSENLGKLPNPAISDLMLGLTLLGDSEVIYPFRVVATQSLYNTLRLLQTEANLQLQLGLACLEYGDTPRALSHFRQALAPHGIKVPFRDRFIAEEYARAMATVLP